jgi:hypothetical protein
LISPRPLISALSGVIPLLIFQAACAPQPSESALPLAHSVVTVDPVGVILDPDPINLGVLKPGQSVEVTLTLQNPRSAEALTVERVETSCSCVSVSPLPTRLESGESDSLAVKFDASKEPDFRGRLSVKLTGLGANESTLFETRLNVEVQSDSSPEAQLEPSEVARDLGFDEKEHGDAPS